MRSAVRPRTAFGPGKARASARMPRAASASRRRRAEDAARRPERQPLPIPDSHVAAPMRVRGSATVSAYPDGPRQARTGPMRREKSAAARTCSVRASGQRVKITAVSAP